MVTIMAISLYNQSNTKDIKVFIYYLYQSECQDIKFYACIAAQNILLAVS